MSQKMNQMLAINTQLPQRSWQRKKPKNLVTLYICLSVNFSDTFLRGTLSKSERVNCWWTSSRLTPFVAQQSVKGGRGVKEFHFIGCVTKTISKFRFQRGNESLHCTFLFYHCTVKQQVCDKCTYKISVSFKLSCGEKVDLMLFII